MSHNSGTSLLSAHVCLPKEEIMSDKVLPPVIIKKYANRRLYNTETSSYITLEHLAAMVRENRDFKVVDAKSNDDITRAVLTQIIVEEEGRGETMLPVNFLRQLISMYGQQVQSVVPQYLEASMEAFRANQDQIRKAFGEAFAANPMTSNAFGNFEKFAEQNVAMMRKASEIFAPKSAPRAEASPEDISDLKSQMAAMQAKLNKLAGQ
jgi:polyhydroxyalkanoate synthesis repressor PhaR